MEINCGPVKVTTLQQSLLMCAGGEVALAASLVSALVKAHLAVSSHFQEYMKLLTNQPKLRGDQHISCPCKAADGEDDEDDEEDHADKEEDASPAEGKIPAAKNVPGGKAGRPEENGEDEDEGAGEEDPSDEDEDEDDDDDDDEEEEEEDDDEEDEDEDNEEDEEALQPPKKRKK